MRCVILCAGFATRLYPLTRSMPKHLLPVGGQTVLDYVVEQLGAVGIRHSVLVTNRVFREAFHRWAAQRTSGLEVQIVDDGSTANGNRLGALGDLQFGLERGSIREDFLVVNGDNLFTFPLRSTLDAFRRRGNTIVLYDVGSLAEAAKMGIATCDEAGRVIAFQEKPPQPATTLVSIGIYAYRQEVRDWVDRYLGEGNCPDKTGSFVEWLYQRTPVYGHRIEPGEGLWFDIGSHEQLARATASLTNIPRCRP
jgi:glucose-1-phosphate thymidylyltransferase